MSDNRTTPMWMIAIALNKHDPGSVTTSFAQGYRVCHSKDEAIGSFVQAIMEQKPGFSVGEVISMQVPEHDLRLALGLENQDG